MKNLTKELEYEDSPSGFVKLYNYKEPFMDFQDGYGYEGVLLYDGESGKVQCHFCGEWFHTLGNHIHKEHNMRAKEYKNIVGLRPNTSLISEEHREKLLSAAKRSKYTPEERAKNLTRYKVGTKLHPEIIKKRAITIARQAKLRESQNKYGTCPMQILDRIEKLSKDKGGKVTQAEVLRHISRNAILRQYGSVKEAIELAGADVRISKRIISKEKAMELLKNFFFTHKRIPTTGDMRRGLLPGHKVYVRHWGSYKIAKKELLKNI